MEAWERVSLGGGGLDRRRALGGHDGVDGALGFGVTVEAVADPDVAQVPLWDGGTEGKGT